MTANTDRVIAVAYTPNLTGAARGRFTPAGWSAIGHARVDRWCRCRGGL